MSVPLGLVVGTSLLVSSPVLWMVHEGSLSVTVAAQRWGICLVACWIALSVIGAVAFPDSRQRVAPQEPEVTHPEAESAATV